MKSFKSRIIFHTVLILTLLFSVLLYSCRSTSHPEKVAPAKVENAVKETELTTIRLTEKAEERLGIETVEAIIRPVVDNFEVGGEIMAPPGTALSVSAPVAGTILQSEGPLVRAGSIVRKGQQILRLLLMPPEQSLMGAREEVAVKQAEYDVAAAKNKRAEQMLQDRAISEKSYQEIEAEFASAGAILKAAKAKLNMLSGTSLDAAAADLSTLVLESPIDGVVQHLNVAPGQTVPAAFLLFNVVSQNPAWVRVPVYSGLLEDVDREQNAIVRSLGDPSTEKSVPAKPIDGPLLSDINSASSDLYYQIDNRTSLFRIGERVRVQLFKKSAGQNIVVPWSAVVYDIDGGTWVYIQIAPHTFTRSRVEVSQSGQNLATITRGVSPGDKVVITAVAELYGTEFGGGK